MALAKVNGIILTCIFTSFPGQVLAEAVFEMRFGSTISIKQLEYQVAAVMYQLRGIVVP